MSGRNAGHFGFHELACFPRSAYIPPPTGPSMFPALGDQDSLPIRDIIIEADEPRRLGADTENGAVDVPSMKRHEHKDTAANNAKHEASGRHMQEMRSGIGKEKKRGTGGHEIRSAMSFDP